nr:glycosyltransferase family 4 protein [Bacteroidales bacterium]
HTNLKTGYYNGFKQIVFKKLPFKRLNTLYYYVISTFHAIIFSKYDLIHLHHRDAAFITIILKIKYPVIITTHGGFSVTDKWKKFEWFFKINERWFVKEANIVTCVSKAEQRNYKKIGLNTIYIPNGINVYSITDDFNQTINKKPYLFFGAGRIIPSKGLHILLQALHLLKYTGLLIIAGELEQIEDYKNEIFSLSNDLNVKFKGLIKEKKELLTTIHNSELFIFPSSLEAMSMMLLEAASVRTPIICTDITENKDIFNEEEVLFFKTNDMVDLAQKIDYALNNIDEMKLRAERALKKLQREYNWENISKDYSNLYNSLIKND